MGSPYTGAMTSRIARLTARWRRPSEPPPADPTRPHPVVRDGIPIAHEGPPGFPGRNEHESDEQGSDEHGGDER